jgi:hypothetical protein
MGLPKISEVLQGQGVAGAIFDVAKREAVDYGKKKIISSANSAIKDGINSIVSKNQKGINKVLDALGLDKGGSSNIYDQVASRPDPLLDFEFMVYMPAISSPWASAPALDPYWIEDIDLPLETFDTDQLKVNGHPVNVIMASTQPEITLQLYAEYTNQAQSYFGAWYSSIRAPNGRYNLPYAKNNAGYKKMLQLVILKGNMPVAILSASGVMPTSRNGFDSKSGGGERRVYSQTLSVDKVYIELVSASDPTKVSVTSGGSIAGQIASSTVSEVSKTLSRTIRGF